MTSLRTRSCRTVFQLLGAALLGPVGAAAPALASNLLQNPDFDENLWGWFESSPFVLYEWSPMDVAGSASSGSARQENVAEFAMGSSGIGQCAAVVGGEEYVVAGSTYVPSGQATVGRAQILFAFKPTGDCAGSATVAYGFEGTNAIFDAWYRFESEAVVAPADANSMQVDLVARKDDAGGSFVAFWDAISVVPEPADPALGASAVLALAALSRGRRRRSPARIAARAIR